jgi:hypothetical protein
MKHDDFKFKQSANLLMVKFTRMVFAPETIKSEAISKSKFVAFINSFELSILKSQTGLQI